MIKVTFTKDIFFADNHSETVFKKDREYEVLGEDKHSIFVQSKPNSNECCEVPKKEEGLLFEYK